MAVTIEVGFKQDQDTRWWYEEDWWIRFTQVENQDWQEVADEIERCGGKHFFDANKRREWIEFDNDADATAFILRWS